MNKGLPTPLVYKGGRTPITGMSKDYLHAGEYRMALEIRLLKERMPNKANADLALKYKEFLEINNRQPITIARRLRELRFILYILGGKDAAHCTKEDIQQVVLEINRLKRRDQEGKPTKEAVAEITKNKIKLCLKDFVRWIAGTEEYPDSVRWIKVNTTAPSKKLPEHMLTVEDITKMIEATDNPRDSCLIALLFETGMRAGEILRLTVGSVVLSSEMSYVMVDYRAKTGARRVPIVFAVPYLTEYINQQRCNAKQQDPLFISLHNKKMELKYEYLSRVLRDTAEKAGLKKPVNPHAFRHSSATRWANLLTESQMKAYLGWTQSSKMASIYVHLSGKNLDDAVKKANGIITNGEPEAPKLTIKRCFKCHTNNSMTAKHCVNCGMELMSGEESIASAIQQREDFEKLQAKMAQLERINGPIVQFLQIVRKKDKKLYAEFEELAAKT